jgi:hypothetical protein
MLSVLLLILENYKQYILIIFYLTILYNMATFKGEKNRKKIDNYMTPKSAWDNIKDLIPKNKIIWEPFYGDGKSGEYLKSLGFNVIHENEDFFENNKGDIIISNPPFSKTESILKKLYEYDKPFILIMPITKISTGYFKKYFKDKIQIIIPPRRIHFKKLIDGKEPEGWKEQCNFECFYYCYKINLPKDILFL